MEDLKICAQEGSVSIEGAGLENLLDEEKEHPLQDVRDALLQVNDAMDEVFWEISYNIIQVYNIYIMYRKHSWRRI